MIKKLGFAFLLTGALLTSIAYANRPVIKQVVAENDVINIDLSDVVLTEEDRQEDTYKISITANYRHHLGGARWVSKSSTLVPTDIPPRDLDFNIEGHPSSIYVYINDILVYYKGYISDLDFIFSDSFETGDAGSWQ